MNEEKDFVDKAKQLSFALLQTLQNETGNEDPEMGMKISLLALTKVSASVLHMVHRTEEQHDEVVDLFVATLIESIKALDGVVTAESATKGVLNKMMRKP
jgi:hypothetical protein